MKRISLSVVLGLALAGLGTAVYASRNSSGTYSLPAGNPVTTKTTITSTWANNTLSDLASEMTNSLDRTGKGAMQAPLLCTDGTVSAPSLSFSNASTSGLYKAGTATPAVAAGGVKIQDWTSSLSTFYAPVVATATGASVAITGTGGSGGGAGLSGTGGSTGGTGVVGQGASSTGSGAVLTGGGTGPGVQGIGGTTSGTGGVFTGGAPNGVGIVATGTGGGVGAQIVNGLQVGASGTTISGSFANSFVYSGGSVSANTCTTNTGLTITGAAVGGTCAATWNFTGNLSLNCMITGSNTVGYTICNGTLGNVNPGSPTVYMRVWQP